MPSEVSSAVALDSDLPPPPPPPPPPPSKSSRPAQQTGLLNFFSVIPREEAHAIWGKRKRENQERDEEERAKILYQEEEWKQERLLDIRGHNHLSQQKHHKKIQRQEIEAGMWNEDGKKLQASQTFI